MKNFSKKNIIILLSTLLYLAVSSGLTVHIHYCMGKWAGTNVSLGYDNSHTCGKCGMKSVKKTACCHDELTFVKLTSSHQPSTYYHSIQNISFQLPPVAYSTVSIPVRENFPHTINYSNAPPGKEHRSICATYCVYRI